MKKTSTLNTEPLSMPISDAPNSIDVSKMSDEELKINYLKDIRKLLMVKVNH